MKHETLELDSKPSIRLVDSPYEKLAWIYEFRDEDDHVLLSHEFAMPPAHIAIGEFFEFPAYDIKGQVTKVTHFLRESENVKSLRHVIEITLRDSH